MRLGGNSALNGADLRTDGGLLVAGDDVGPSAEVVALATDQDDSNALVAPGGIDRVDEPGHHGVVDGIANSGSAQPQLEDAFLQLDAQAITAR